MLDAPLYPLEFEPIFKSVPWGGRRLQELLRPTDFPEGPVGEAWVLSDQGANQSRIAKGPLRGVVLRQLVEQIPERLFGKKSRRHTCFPLLLKFIDAHEPLSVQVHPDDRHADLVPLGQRGKTEAWVVLHAEPDSRIYAGLRPGVGEAELRRAMQANQVPECLHSFTPHAGDCLFIPAGTVHALGAGLVIFEVQQTSDVTFRLFDWNRRDAKTGKPRQLHIEEAWACIDFGKGPCDPVVPAADPAQLQRQQLVSCAHFRLERWTSSQPTDVGHSSACRILVGISGNAELEYGEEVYPLRPGTVLLIPAEIDVRTCRPAGTATWLECTFPA